MRAATTVMSPGLAAPWETTEPVSVYSSCKAPFSAAKEGVNLRGTAWETRSIDRKVVALNHSKLSLTQVFVFIMQESCWETHEGKERPGGK